MSPRHFGPVLQFLLPSVILTILLIVVFTDGRYFGKGLMHVIYDYMGPVIFRSASDDANWSRIVGALSLRGEEFVLDVGTATGALPLAIASIPGFRGRVTGVDWSRRMIEVARRRAADEGREDLVTFEVVDVRKGLPFDGASHDVVICLGLLEAVHRPEELLAELRRVLKKDGALALSLYRGWGSLGPALGLDWYVRNLERLGMANVSRIRFRRSQDLILARAE